MRFVVKIGTSTLTHATGHLNIRRVEALCRVISDIKNAGHEVILVSSGAIGMGVGKLGLRQRPKDIPSKQAAAAVGQCELMYTYDKLFGEHHHTVAQLLITGDDVANEKRHQNFKNTLNRLLELGAVPIINENDTIATEEIVIGDNDTLAAIVAISINAQLLVLLSDIDGLYTADPHTHPDAKLISRVEKVDEKILALDLSLLDAIIVNETEGNGLSGKTEPEAILAELLTRYPKMKIVLTLGKQGAVYADVQTRASCNIIKMPVKDTTAAGDTFTGYFFSALMRGEAPAKALQIATAASAITVSRMGAAPSIPTVDEVKALLEKQG